MFADLNNQLTTDEFLLYGIASAQEGSFLELYQRYNRSVYSLAKRILRTNSDAEEVTQDVFVKIWDKALEYAPHKGKVSTWILTIAHHSAIDALRKRNSRASLPMFDEELEQIPQATQTDLLEQSMIQNALAKLEPQEQMCIELAYFEGLSHAQLAKHTELPLGTIKTRIRLALVKLRNAIGE
jgi:RNA polymerase sigma factor (sigma-70 family)